MLYLRDQTHSYAYEKIVINRSCSGCIIRLRKR